MSRKRDKTNPRKIPRSQKDVDDAEKRGWERGTREALVIFLYSLINRHSPPEGDDQQFMKDIKQLSEDIHDTCDSVEKGYIVAADMEKVLTDEYQIALDFT